MVKKWRSAIFVLAPAVVCAGLFLPTGVMAEDSLTDDTTFQVSITDFLTLTLDQTDNVAQLSSQVRFNTGSISALVSTNNAAGYTLTFQDTDDRNGLEREGYSRASTEDKPLYNIPSIAANTEYANLADDTWGYYLGTGEPTLATYKPIPLTAEEINSSDTPITADTTKVDFGVKISATRPGGTYEDTLTFSAVATPLPAENPFDVAFSAAGKSKDATTNKYKMQDMTASICDAVATPTASDYSDTPETQLVDIRDGKLYWVAKLMDGHCWMTQNLDLNLDSTKTYTHSDTDLGWGTDTATTSWTPERSTIPVTGIDSSGSISGWDDDPDNPYSIDTGDWYWTDTWYTSTVNNYLNGNAGDKFSLTPYQGNGLHGHVGNYYNWTAAIASNDSSSYDSSTISDASNNPQNSICPAGWRLPIISITGSDDFERLTILYGNTRNNDQSITASPLYFVRSGSVGFGNVGSGNMYDPGYWGNYWSSTVDDGYGSVFFLEFTSDGINLTGDGRSSGFSVRCVARDAAPSPSPDPDPDTTTFDEAYAAAGKAKDSTTGKYKMQDMTSSICSAVTNEQTTEVVDARDNTIYHVGKMLDGRCWMQDNLALDPTQSSAQANLTPSTTNATQAAITNYLNGGNPDGNAGWATTAVSYETSSSVYNQPRINVDSKDIIPQGDDPLASTAQAEGWKVGVYYNYCAASIGTYCYAGGSGVDTDATSAIDVKNDICPANWRMPTGYSYDATTRPDGGEYQALYNAYPAISGGDSQYTRFRKAFRLPLSGLFYNGSPGGQGSYAYVWSSTFGVSYSMYNLNAITSDIGPQGYSYRYYGQSVRCVAKGAQE